MSKALAMSMKILLLFIIIAILILLYVKRYEKIGIFFPVREITQTPQERGLAYEEVEILTADRTTINAWFCKGGDGALTILFCHGNAGNISHRLDILEMLVRAGFDVFIFDYRGFGKSQGSPSEKGIYMDTEASYTYLVKEKKVPKKDIIVYGESIGGSVAVDLASKKEVGLLIVQSTFSSALDMAKIIFPWLPRWIVKNLAGVDFDSALKIKNIKVPKLIIHSREDEIVPFALGKKIFDEAPRPKEFYIMRGSHNEGVYVYSEEFISRIKDFVARYRH